MLRPNHQEIVRERLRGRIRTLRGEIAVVCLVRDGGLLGENSAYIGSLVYNNEEKGKVPHNREPSPFRLGEIKMGERKYTRKAGKETIQYSQILR